MTWNVNGWTTVKEALFTSIIETISPDICCITETHLTKDSINVPNYTVLYHHRNMKHVNAKTVHGGIALLIKNKIRSEFKYEICDNSLDGLLIVKFCNIFTGYTFACINTYAAPQGSRWCNINDIFDNIRVFCYTNVVDATILMGDINARVGNLIDHDPCLDDSSNLPARVTLDTQKNNHGIEFCELLKDCKLGIVNGRIEPHNNDYTCHKENGKSVIDYFACDYNTLKSVKHFEVLNMTNDIIINACDRLGITKTTDHSIVLCMLGELSVFYEHISKESEPKRIYYYNNIPTNFMNNATWQNTIDDLISNKLEHVKNQRELDNWYSIFLKEIFQEMDSNLKYRDDSGNDKIKCKLHKPYWDLELSNAFRELHKMKNKCDKVTFKIKRRSFDRLLRYKERAHISNKLNTIEWDFTKNPKKFWNHIRNLGPISKSELPNCVEIDGTLTHDEKTVIEFWKSEFESLYRKSDQDRVQYDGGFNSEIKRDLLHLEEFALSQNDNELNFDITIEETKQAIDKLKLNKATGIDLIKNEIIKQPGFLKCAFKLFTFCFQTGLVPSIWRNGLISPIPKNSSLNRYLPLSYRGLMLISTLEKCYTSILNTRLTNHLETQDIIADEQGGFRKGYSCNDQIFSLVSMIKQRLLVKKILILRICGSEKIL